MTVLTYDDKVTRSNIHIVYMNNNNNTQTFTIKAQSTVSLTIGEYKVDLTQSQAIDLYYKLREVLNMPLTFPYIQPYTPPYTPIPYASATGTQLTAGLMNYSNSTNTTTAAMPNNYVPVTTGYSFVTGQAPTVLKG